MKICWDNIEKLKIGRYGYLADGKRSYIEKTCSYCGNEYLGIKGHHSKFCSKSCMSKNIPLENKHGLFEKGHDGMKGENNPNWVYGKHKNYCNKHNYVWNIFGEKNCFLCNKSLEQYISETGKRFDMHCRTKDYDLMELWNWKTVCGNGCHQTLEKIEK